VATPIPPATDRVEQIDERLRSLFGEGLDPWQRIMVHYLSAQDENDKWLLPVVGAVVARQNGKSHAVVGRILDDLDRGKSVIACAQNLQVAHRWWRKVADLYDEKENGPLAHLCKKISFAGGSTFIRLHNGGEYRLVAANHKAARGLDAIDTLWMDEVREQRDWRAHDALEPLTTVSKDPQLILTSNAGDVGSVVLNKYQDDAWQVANGTLDDPALGWVEWSAAPGASLDDRAAWAQANPNAGHRFPWKVLEQKFGRAGANPAGWRTERMCQRADAMGAVIDGSEWARLEQPTPASFDTPAYMAFELDPLRRSAVITVGNLVDGAPHIRCASVFTADLDKGEEVSDRQVADAVYEIAKQVRPKRIGYLEGTGGTVAAMLAPARPKLALENMQGQKSARACQLLFDQVTTGALSHDGNPTIALHISTAVREDTNSGGWWFSRVRSPGPIPGATAAAVATYLTLTPSRRAVVVVGGAA
jgi:phage terminase large subunit-like protein